MALLGSVIAGPQALARFAGRAPLNTDDRPVVSYRAHAHHLRAPTAGRATG